MKLRVSFIILAILGSIGAILTIAKYPSSPHTISYDDLGKYSLLSLLY
ncbi:hypothetical protein ACUXTG_001830 [Staphylococcus capitis]